MQKAGASYKTWTDRTNKVFKNQGFVPNINQPIRFTIATDLSEQSWKINNRFLAIIMALLVVTNENGYTKFVSGRESELMNKIA
jgi:hypothetical protein